jgi:hypothetical protein
MDLLEWESNGETYYMGKGGNMNKHYILEGKDIKEVDLMTWAKWFGKAERHIGDDTVEGVRISTVFLGLDHSFGAGSPVLFETLVFGGPLDGEMDRYRI